MKILIIILALLNSVYAQVKDAQEALSLINYESFTHKKLDNKNDIIYFQLHPEYEEGMNPKNGAPIEFFFGEFDDTPKSIERLKYIKSLLDEEKRIFPTSSLETKVITTNTDKSSDDQSIKRIHEILDFENEFTYEQAPKNFAEKQRAPSAIKMGRKFWTFVRASLVGGSAIASFVIIDGFPISKAISTGVWGGLLSGIFTYHNDKYGKFLTKQHMGNWVFNAKNKAAKKVRSILGINENKEVRTRKVFNQILANEHPGLKKNNPKLFNKLLDKKVKNHFLKKLSHPEEYMKWYLTELFYVGSALKIPQIANGVGVYDALGNPISTMGHISDVAVSGAKGMLAQAPGDIAIQKRKHQKILELEKAVLSGKVKVEDKAKLLADIKLYKTGSNKFKIDLAHKSLQKVENWARSRATFLSVVSVVGVSLDMIGVPAGTPILIGTGIGGTAYYGKVEGWFSFEKLKKLPKNTFQKFKEFLKNPLSYAMQPIHKKRCLAPFMMPKLN
ncbi:MAG: hypothetical protein N4A33_11125 [Bacteriovoracaceae bacterium]|jgi:hypothetical protein|nr:hypothetical protein [Bacteriovoracaceae bacterium]